MKISVVIPVFNQAPYIEECINSLLANNSEQFEIIISDNHSTDGTLNIIKGYDDRRIKCVQPLSKLSPFANLRFAYFHATGTHVHFIGGDDYFEEGVLDYVLEVIEDNRVFIGEMISFSDQTKKTKYVRNKRDWLEEKLFNGSDFISNYLSQINHDEIMLSFIPRKLLKPLMNLSDNSNENLFLWFGLSIFSDQDIANNVGYISKTVVHKRYDQINAVGSASDEFNSKLSSKLKFLSCLGSIYNSVIVLILSKNIVVFLKLLFLNRSYDRSQNQKGGYMGRGKLGSKCWSFGPVITLLLSPFFDFYIVSKHFYEKNINKYGYKKTG